MFGICGKFGGAWGLMFTIGWYNTGFECVWGFICLGCRFVMEVSAYFGFWLFTLVIFGGCDIWFLLTFRFVWLWWFLVFGCMLGSLFLGLVGLRFAELWIGCFEFCCILNTS